MARLLVEACTAEWTSGDVVRRLLVGVSVSRVDSGEPVTGLTPENFRLVTDRVQGLAVREVTEWRWERDLVEPSGCYQLAIGYTHQQSFPQGLRFVFGIQVRTFTDDAPPQVVDLGQTIMELTSLGH